MNRFLILATILGGVFLFNPLAIGQGLGQTDSHLGYRSSAYRYPPYHSVYPVQVRPSGYAAGYTYTYPTIYPSNRYYNSYRYPGVLAYPYRYPSPVVRGYRVSPNQSGSPFGSAHSSQYFGNPHASQYFGR